MTPFERIQRNKGMQAFAFEHEKPATPTAPFPRNVSGLTVLVLAITPLMYKAMLAPTAENIVGYGGLTACFGLALWSMAAGLKAEAIYDAAPVARAPARPRKMVGAGLMGLGAAGLTWFQGGDIWQAASVMVVTTLLCAVAFGRDPGRHKGFETVQARQSHKIDDLTARTGLLMERVREAAAIHGDRDVMPRVRAFDDAVDALLSAAMHDPARVGALRKFFGVYLESAAEASERFAAVYSGTGDPQAKQKHLDLLEKLTDAFGAKAHDYAAAGQIKLDVEHEVLTTALSQELRRAT